MKGCRWTAVGLTGELEPALALSLQDDLELPDMITDDTAERRLLYG